MSATVMSATVAIKVPFLMKVIVTGPVVQMVAMRYVSTRVVVVMASVVPVVVRPPLDLRVISTSRAIDYLRAVTIAVRVTHVEMDVGSANVESEASKSVCCLRCLRIEANERECCNRCYAQRDSS